MENNEMRDKDINNYFQQYRRWKLLYSQNQDYYYNLFNGETLQNFICAQCWPETSVEIFRFRQFDVERKIFWTSRI